MLKPELNQLVAELAIESRNELSRINSSNQNLSAMLSMRKVFKSMCYDSNSAKQQFCLDVRNKNVYKTDSSPKVPKMNENVMFIDLPNECKVDFISELPIDIIQKILQMLDTESLITARSVSKKWKVMCEYALKQRGVQHKISYNKRTQEMNPYYKEALWRLLMFNIKKKYGKPFPFT
ncbi:hypothetical protein P5V15_003950 [Pogonomyrmex californicus]